MAAQRVSEPWVFVSHSSRDLGGVRRIRNFLEEQCAFPILFFLKCVSEDDELDQLLKREIKARNFFLLCDSPAAQGSRWVREEVEFVKGLAGKHYKEVALSTDWEEQKQQIEQLLRQATAFLSYARVDLPRITPYADALARSDLGIFFTDYNLLPGQNWQQAIYQALHEAAETGHLVQFLSQASLASRWVTAEYQAFAQLQNDGSRTIFVDLEPVDHLLPPHIQTLQRLDFYRHDAATNTTRLLQSLGIG